jgi:hypothetical protein
MSGRPGRAEMRAGFDCLWCVRGSEAAVMAEHAQGRGLRIAWNGR